MFNKQNIINKIERFDYKYEFKNETLIIYLPLLCYLKIRILENKIKFSSHIRFGFNFLSLELNFLLYSLAFYAVSYFYWETIDKGLLILFGLFIIYFVVCFIKIESLKIIIHNWNDKES